MATSAGTIPINATFNGAQLERDVLSALNRIQSKSTLNLNTRNFTQPLGKITGLANEFNKSLEASNARVVAFGASAGVIFAVQKSFSALVTTTIEVEKSLTDINIVLNTSAKGIKQFGDQLFDVAKQTGSSFKNVAAAATEFSRQGLGLEETLKRTRDALILTRLSGLDVVSSTEALTAAVNSFTKEALTTTDVVNKLAAVDAKFAVSSRDLSEALQRVGSSASEAGVSFDELLGIVTSVQQTTARGGAVIGNALKTIFTRIERPQVISDLRDFGVAVTDVSGNALPTIKVIENLAQSFQNLNPVVKSQVAELVGGVYQINILKAALADVSKQNSAFAEATRTSSQAADEAILKNKALNESLSALINETTVNFTQFATKIGGASVAPGIRKVLGFVNEALESVNEKDSESVGEKIATGLLKGITDFVTGPGLGLGALAVGKLIGNFATFAGDATKNILGLNTLGRQQAVVQGEISKILSSNPQLIQQILAGTKSRLQVEKEIKQILIEQAAISEKIKTSSADIGARFLASGLGVSTSGAITGRRSSGGYIPARQQAAEMVGAMQGGYAPGKVVDAPKSIGGVMNTAETVKYVPGFAQPYILPPQGSRAARDLASKSMAKNGINPYQAKGFVPNFAPRSLENPSYGDSDWWFGSGLKAPVSLSQIQTGTAAAWSADKGFYRTDGKNFSGNDLNTFIRRGASYGDIRRYLPDSFFQDDPRFKAGVSIDQLRREYKPGAKIATTESVKEEVRRIFEPYTPPASMLIWDLAGKNNDQDEIVDLEKLTGEKKQAGRSYKIKIRALSGSALNEERFGLVERTSKFARDITKKLASGIPGAKSDYSDAEVDDYFNKTGKNYNVLAGTIFEAGTNLAASYVRDRAFKGSMGRSGSGGDFDIMGGSNLSNVQKFFPGFTDSYGDYKLNNSYDSMREFIAKVEKEFPIEISNHFAKQESKIAGITTSAKGFIPNFAPEQISFDWSDDNTLSIGSPPPVPVNVNEPMQIAERSGSSLFINPDGTLKVSFLRSSEGNPLFSIIKALKKGLIKKIDAGAVIGPRVPNLITGLKNVLPDLRKNSPLVPSSIPIVGSFSPKSLVRNLYRSKGELEYSLDEGSIGQINKYLNAKGFELKKGSTNPYDNYSIINKSTNKADAFYDSKDQLYLPESFSMNSYMAKKLISIPGINLNLNKKRKAGSSDYNREDLSKLRKAFEEMGVLGTSEQGKTVWKNVLDHGYGDYVKLEDIYPNGLSKGFIPNFNPVKEAMAREMAAGYSSSQVKVGQSQKLKTSFNPMGLGVYNSTEGSLNNGIGLAEKAGINPKTKGMSAKGYIPNFAEFTGLDLFAVTSSLVGLGYSVKEVANTFKTLNQSTNDVIKENSSLAASLSQELGQIPRDLKKKTTAISDEIKKTFTNIDLKTLQQKKGTVAPLVMGPPTRDKFGIITSSPQAASPEQLARLEELRKELEQAKKEASARNKETRARLKEARENIAQTNVPLFSGASLKTGGRLNNLIKGAGTGTGLIASTVANIGAQFVPEENKTLQAGLSGFGDIASMAGVGAAFGPPGAAVGAIIGAATAFKKISDAKAEQAIDKINKSLEDIRERATEFSGAAQNYAVSLESLQNALNDPKTRPDALLRFQNNLSEALNSIPKEFRNKVLSAGTDINKISEAISNINKEMGDTQKNLERQLAITKVIKEESSIFGNASVSSKNQKLLNALFSSSINAEAVNKNFTGEDFSKFIDSLKSEIIKTTTTTVPTYGASGVTQTQVTKSSLNKEALENVKTQLKQKGVLSDAIIDQLDEAFNKLDLAAVQSIFDDLKKSGIIITDNSKRSKILGDILQENTKRVNENAEAIKELNSQYNDINLQISNQIDIEKNRAKTIREINKIQAEGVISVQRAKVKGLLDASSPFISEGARNEIQGQLDINEIIARQSSKIQEASNKVLDSFTDILTKRAEEARSTVLPAIEGAKDDKAIQKERSVFQQQIQKLTPLITESIKEINKGGNIGDIQQNLISQITAFAGFKPEQKNVLVQAIESSFSDFQNTLAEIKAQGDVDLSIQEAQRDYQKQSLALNQRLSFAGGAQALGTTGKAGVSDLFDNISDLVSELRQSNNIGNVAQRGSGAFKLLDVLTNQLQLNRAVQAPVPFRNAQSFNSQVSSDLGPLVGTAIAGRVQQIRESVDLARRVTEIQTGKSTSGTALGTAFDQAKEGAVRTALDQIASQFKLENMGSYLDVLQKEAQFLNDLTQDQNQILADTLPTSINDNFKNVIESQVGVKLDSLTKSLTDVVNKLSISTKTNILESERQNLLPAIGTEFRKEILQTITAAGTLKDLAPGTPVTPTRDRSNLAIKGGPIVPLNPTVLEGTYEKLARDLNEKYKSQLGDQVITAEQIKSIQAKNNEIATALNASPLMSVNAQSAFGPYAGGYNNAVPESMKATAQFKPRAISEALSSARSNQNRLDDLFINRLEADKDLVNINEEINRLLEEDANDTNKRADLIKLQTDLRKKTLEQENKIAKDQFDLYYKSSFGRTFFKDEKAAQANALIESEARQGRVAFGAITQKNTEYNRADFARDTGQLIDTFQTDFKSGIASAFGEAIKGTKTLKDAFRDMFQGILNRMLDKSLEMGVDALFAFGKSYAQSRKDGGLIRGYNSGGMVVGGSGMKDDVPAMMSGGEFVIKKSSVNKYGTGYLKALNGGLVPKYATGGFSIGPMQNEFLYNNSDRPTSGEYAVDSRLSAMALTDENNPQNRLREDRFNKLDQYLQDRAQFEKDKQQALKSYRNQVNSTFYSGLTAAAVQLGAAGLTVGAQNLKTKPLPSNISGAGLEPGGANLSQAQLNAQYARYGRANGGYIPKFAGGGYTGKDNIPALLMGGEYVMNKKAVDMYGRDFMGQLNSGTLPKYAAGGMVGTSYAAQGNPQTSIEELVTALNTLNENLSKDNGITQAESGKVSAAGATQESGMSVVNNISINVAQGGEVTSEASSNTQQGKTNNQNNQNNIQNNAKLAELLRSKVVEVLVEQKRPGGLLYASR